MLPFRLCCALAAFSAFAQQSDAVLNVRHIIGLENIKHDAGGRLSIENRTMQFAGEKSAQIPVASIQDVFVGTETTQAGGKAGTVAKTAAIAAPYDSGAALSLLLRTKVDILTVTYRDDSGGMHAAIFALPKGDAEKFRERLTAGARPGEAKPEAETHTENHAVTGPARQAILIEPVETVDTRIPIGFRMAIYERLIERVQETKKFQKVFRSGDRGAANYPDLATLHTTVQKFKEGSQLERELTTLLGATKVDVTASVTGRDGKALLERNVEGKVRFFGENLGATTDLAKRIAKVLRERL